MLEVSAIRTGYEGVEVVHEVDLAVNEGETVCVLGANGAGKSTMLRAIMRQLPLWGGSVRFSGMFSPKPRPLCPRIAAWGMCRRDGECWPR